MGVEQVLQNSRKKLQDLQIYKSVAPFGIRIPQTNKYVKLRYLKYWLFIECGNINHRQKTFGVIADNYTFHIN
jgi:hypothetical protein